MKISIVGKGKMGQAVSNYLQNNQTKYQLGQIFDSNNPVSLAKLKDSKIIIDCSVGSVFLANLPIFLEAKQEILVVATGWDQNLAEVKNLVEKNHGKLFWADNYSISMMIYKEILKMTCQLLKNNPEFDVYGLEMHHTGKKDAPAGTTKQIAKLILENFATKKEVLYNLPTAQISPETLHIACLRGGTDNIVHDFYFDSPDELLQIKHIAKSQKAFVNGIFRAVDFLQTQENGFFGLQDLF